MQTVFWLFICCAAWAEFRKRFAQYSERSAMNSQLCTLPVTEGRRGAGCKHDISIYKVNLKLMSGHFDRQDRTAQILSSRGGVEGRGWGVAASRALSAWVAVLLFKLFNLGISFSAWHRCIDFRTQVSFKSEVWGTCEQFHSVWLWEEKCWWQLVFSAVYKIICFHWVGIKVRLFAWWPLFLFFFAPYSVWLLMSAAAPSPQQIHCKSVKTGIFNQTTKPYLAR